VWKRQTALTALVLLAITILVSRTRMLFFPLYQVQSQDVLPLMVLSVSLFAAAFWTPAWRLPERLPKARYLWIAGLTIAGLLWLGTYALMGNFPLSADERMVVFDMSVFDGRHLATPVAEFWRPYARALIPSFLLNEDMPTGLVSAYLPMNSLLRLIFSKLADPALFNPLLALAGGVALLDIARRTFRDDGPACCVTLLVYALSAQMLVNAMTVYSMTGHMALNLIWLAAFLRGGRRGHSLAILTGFVATGLHQLVFHPFYVAPFLLWRLRHREWKLVLLYAAAYAAIMLWWVYYPVLAGHAVASTVEQPPNSNFVVRILSTLREPDAETVITMFLNLLRFVAWQNLALVPLLSAAVVVAVRDRGFPAVLLLGIALWLAFISLVIPFQGHGWGFRYLHPYLGSFALLAGYGYRELRAEIGQRADGFVLTLSAMTALAAIPLLFAAAYRFVEPHVALDRLIAKQRTPMILIDTDFGITADGGWVSNAVEDVRNLPDLSNRPLRFASVFMTPELLEGLCRQGQVTLITRADERRAGFKLDVPADSARFNELVDPVRKNMPDCFVSAAGRHSVPDSSLDKHGS
jgi:hypothetical protein